MMSDSDLVGMASNDENADETATTTDGAVKAGDGKHVFQTDSLDELDVGPDYSSGKGGVVEGERMQVSVVHKPKGTGARPHKHSNEQFSYVLQGTLRVNVADNEEEIAEEGDIIYLPADTKHNTIATTDEDVYFFTVKDLSQGIAGEPVDKSSDEAHYEPGYEPDEE